MHIYRLPFNAQRRNFRFLAHTLILLALALLFSVGAQAQSESGSAALEGTITDPNAQPLPGAIITIRQQETGYTRRLTTDVLGQFVASVLPIGLYVVEVSANGFATTRRENVLLTVGNTETINLTMKVAGVNEQIVVSSEQSAIDTEEGATGSTIEQRSIRDLPIRGRNFTDFVQLTPGIVQESDRKGLVIAVCGKKNTASLPPR